MSLVQIEGPLLGQSDVVARVLRSLPDWFGIEEATLTYIERAGTLPTFVAREDGDVVGFVSVERHFEHAAELHVLGVVPEAHRRGIGRALLAAAEAWAAGQGVEYMQVKTVGPSRPCPFYDRTRTFYLSVGYRPLEEMKTLWNETNPCLVLVKRISE